MTETPGIGHNSRQDFNGYTGRLHQWRRARAALVSNRVPVEVVRLRVKRAAALGLDYGTYAGIRATTGRDIVALLFSSNALGMLRRAEVAAREAEKIAALAAERGALVHRPLAPVAAPPLDWAATAPRFTDSDGQAREALLTPLRQRKLPADAVLLVGLPGWEASWCASARLAGFVPAERFFAPGR